MRRIGKRLVDAVGKVGPHALQLIGQAAPTGQRTHRIDHHRDRDDKGGQPHNQHRQMAEQPNTAGSTTRQTHNAPKPNAQAQYRQMRPCKLNGRCE